MDENVERIEQYLLGQMTKKSARDFETEMERNPSLRKEVAELKVIHNALEVSVEDDLRARLQDLAVKGRLLGPEDRKYDRRYFLALAATLLLLLTAGLWWYSDFSSSELTAFANENYISYGNTNLRAEGAENQYDDGLELINNDQLLEAINWFMERQSQHPIDYEATFILGDLQQRSENYEEAKQSFLSIFENNSLIWGERAAWNYLSIAARYGWDEKADELLQNLRQDINHSYHERAIRMAELLKK